MKKWMSGVVTLTLLVLVLPGAALAQAPEGCDDTYVVQPGDTLTTIAVELYDNPWAYPLLVFATNQAASQDDDFQAIADPNLIEVGWTLCVPEDETAFGAVGVDAFKNLTYLSEWTHEGTAPLVDGAYRESAAPGSATQTVVTLHDRMAFGYSAGGQQFAAVVLVTDPGGSGTFYELAALTFEDGEPQHVASVLLGDRVKLLSVAVEDGEVVVEMIAHGPDDPMCCPTQDVVQRYVLRGEEWVEAAEEERPELVGTVWEWERFVGGDDSVIEVEDPTQYTLLLTDEGTYQVKTDCNRAGGRYTLDGPSLTLLPGPATLAECGPESLYDEFLSMLGDVRTYVRPDGGDQLVLNLFADAGNLFFRPAEVEGATKTASLVDTLWQWQSTVDADGEESEVENPDQYTLLLNADGTFAAQIDCNRGRGTYSAEPGLSGEISILLGPMTRAACGPDSLDQAFIDALADAVEFQLGEDGDELRLTLEEGSEWVFAAADQGTGEQSLEGTSWTLLTYDDGTGDLVPVLEETEITATFVDGTLAGVAGCNNYSASARLEGESLTVGLAVVTRKICPAPEGIMEQERAYLASLDAVAAYRLQEGQLELLDAEGGAVATYEVAEAAD